MKPKTRLQHRVTELSALLPKVTELQKEWSNSNHKKYFVRHYNNFICLECNHSWKTLQESTGKTTESNCPNCNNKIELIDKNNPKFYYYHIFAIITVYQEFQVIRYFSTWKYMSKKDLPRYQTVELYQEWDTDYVKNTVVIGLNKYPNFNGDGFIHRSNFDIKPSYSLIGTYRHYITPDLYYPEYSVLPIFNRNGFSGNFYGCRPRQFFINLLQKTEFETLVKLKNKELIVACLYNWHSFKRFWKQILICIKHKFVFEDFGLWYDYINALKYLGFDINNPKFICPENLKEAHDFYISKQIAKQEKQRRKEEEKGAVYLKTKKKCFENLIIKEGKFNIIPLLNVEDFKEEGRKLNHCVYASKYHNKENSLILSARIENEPIETIEISLSTLDILQSRGRSNEPTEYHDEILRITKENLPKIKRLVR